ncbi:hypothetical protein [Lentibacillus salinarum]|uniref:Uncharacterized protein n=1 Tax=Lentibacillus salinarum TaxID=446820 RepID=A0ABW3ZWV4_9BACI
MTTIKQKMNWKVLGIMAVFSTAMILFMMPDIVQAASVPDQTSDITSRDLDSTVGEIVKIIIRFLAGIAGVILLGKLVLDGMKLIGSSGNPQTRTEAIHGIMWSLAGGILAIGASVFAGVIVGLIQNIV